MWHQDARKDGGISAVGVLEVGQHRELVDTPKLRAAVVLRTSKSAPWGEEKLADVAFPRLAGTKGRLRLNRVYASPERAIFAAEAVQCRTYAFKSRG